MWAITDIGRSIASEAEVKRRVKEVCAGQQEGPRNEALPEEDDELEEPAPEQSWEEALLAILRGLDPAQFERLCQRLLRESGFIKVEVT